MENKVQWTTVFNGTTQRHTTKQHAVRHIRNLLGGEHKAIHRDGHTYIVSTKTN